MEFRLSNSEALKSARNKDALLKLLINEHNKGYVRIGNASSDLGIPLNELTELYQYLAWTWRKDCILSNKDYELWIDTPYFPEIKQFINSGGFEKEQKLKDAQYRNTKFSFVFSVTALILSVLSWFKDYIVHFIKLLYNTSLF